MSASLAMDPQLAEYITAAINQKASDIHLISGAPAVVRRFGRLYTVSEGPLSPDTVAKMIQSVLSEKTFEDFLNKKELDFSVASGNVRLRANAYFEKSSPALSLRLITADIPKIQELGLPEVVRNFTKSSQGFLLITGPTGHGKSTTLAALVEHINTERSEHIITLEDPIEYIFTPRRSIISQREVGVDTLNFADALRSALREDPNVILVGEMRDLETIEAALTLAETGHLVFATLHTNSAAQTADRIVDVFPSHKQSQIRLQLSSVLLGIVSQRLLPKIQGGRILACEVLVANNAVRNLIREGKNHQIPNVIATGAADGMISLDKQLVQLVTQGFITAEEATSWAVDQKNFKLQLYQHV